MLNIKKQIDKVMKHLKLFEAENQYEQFKSDSNFLLPNVSYTIDTNKVFYNPSVSISFKPMSIFVNKDEGFFAGPYDSKWWDLTNRTVETIDGTRYIWEYSYSKNIEPHYEENYSWYVITETTTPSLMENVRVVSKNDVDSGSTNIPTLIYGWITQIEEKQ